MSALLPWSDPIRAIGTTLRHPFPQLRAHAERRSTCEVAVTLHVTETVIPSAADAIAFLNRMPVDSRNLAFAPCSKAGGDEVSPMPMPFDADHPPAGWRSIKDVPPVSVLAPVSTSSSQMERFQRGADVQIYSATCRGLKQLSFALGRKTAKIGSCGVGQFEERLQSLGRDRYGAVRRDGYANVHE